MKYEETLGASLACRGVSRRGVLKFCASLASLMALPPALAVTMAQSLVLARRQSVIWLSFQECTGCTESIFRSHSPAIESLIFDAISLDYHHTLQAGAGGAAELARQQAITENRGRYLVVVDGSIPLKDGGVYSTIAGRTNLDILQETAAHAAALIAVGTCAAYGGLPRAHPDPTGAVAVADVIRDKPIINVPGCPPIPVVMTGVIVHFLTLGTIPELDAFGRPRVFFGETIHDRCYRRPFYDQGRFAAGFDDEGARNGWCLYELGCKGPVTYNACATVRWNGDVSFPIQSGHGCLGCSEPGFWDKGSFYQPLSAATFSGGGKVAAAAVAGAAAGLGAACLARHRQDSIAGDK